MRYQLAGLLCIVMGLSACASGTVPTSPEETISVGANQPTTQPTEPQILTVMTHDSFAVSAEVVAAFEQANQATLRIITSGDVGTALNRAILSRDKPIADVFYGVDNTFLSRALDEEVAQLLIGLRRELPRFSRARALHHLDLSPLRAMTQTVSPAVPPPLRPWLFLQLFPAARFRVSNLRGRSCGGTDRLPDSRYTAFARDPTAAYGPRDRPRCPDGDRRGGGSPDRGLP